MNEQVKGLACGREDDLVSFLYDEMDEAAARSFQTHTNNCAACSRQLAAFQNIRTSVGAWRNETLGMATPHVTSFAVDRGKPSALAAFREFFNLSPLWLKGTVAFASVLFCVLAVLAVARLRDVPSSPVVALPAENRSTEEFNAAVERRVQDELKRRQTSAITSDVAPPVVTASVTRSNKRLGSVAVASNGTNARRPLTKFEREELAADLRLIAGANDVELDLLDDRINQ